MLWQSLLRKYAELSVCRFGQISIREAIKFRALIPLDMPLNSDSRQQQKQDPWEKRKLS